MLFRLQNMDSRGVIRKIFRSKDLQLSKNALHMALMGAVSGAVWGNGLTLNCPVSIQLSGIVGLLSVTAVTVECDEKKEGVSDSSGHGHLISCPLALLTVNQVTYSL
jgi:hypothetical protein